MKSEFSKKIIAIIIAAAFIIPVLIFGESAVSESSPGTLSTTHPPAEITISSNPAYLTAESDVTVSITVTNTNSYFGSTSVRPSGDPGSETDDPTVTEAPTNTPGPQIGTYLNVNIINSYGAQFVPCSIEPGSTATFTAVLHVTDVMIGTPLTFTVEWQEFNGTIYPTYSQQVQLTIGRANTVYLTLNRTMSKTSAVQGEQVTISYVLVNTGTVTLNNIRLVDEKIAGTAPIISGITLESGKSYQYNYTYTMGRESVVSKPVAYFRYSGSSTEYSVTAPKQTLGLMNAQLTKEVVMGSPSAEGVDFTIYLTNNGNRTLSDLVVKDELGNLVASGFSLAIGETKIIPYFVQNPTYVRYVVFSITGKNDDIPFSDNTKSYAVRPYIDPTKLGIDFSVEVVHPLNSDNVISLSFYLQNTGSIDYHNVSITEKNLGLQVGTPYEVLRPSNEPRVIPCELQIDGERTLVFELYAEDTSGNSYYYEIQLNANYGGDILPSGETPKPATPSVVEDPELGHKLDSLLTETGEKLTSVYKTLGIVITIVIIALIILAIVEVTLRLKLKKDGAEKGSGRASSDEGTSDENN